MSQIPVTPFEKRFRARVLIPGAVVLLLTAALCAAGVYITGRNTDTMALFGQQAEVWRATASGMDELAVAQESIALCDQCMREARAAKPDLAWLDKNIGARLHELHDADATYILDASDHPIYASLAGRSQPPATYESVAPAVGRFVALARGEIKRPSGRSNLNERLPGSPPEPLVLPPQPGMWDQPVTVNPTVRTTPNVIHATDMVRLGERVAFVSAMQMKWLDGSRAAANQPAPVLVSLRYLDDKFLTALGRQGMLAEPRLAMHPRLGADETSAPILDSDGAPLTTIVWKPMLVGSMAMKLLLLPAVAMFAIVALLVLLMSLKLRKMMRQDDQHLVKLRQAHIELQAKEAQAHHLAYHDVLTGLPNRALFNDNCDRALLRARHGEKMAIVLLDLDRFKNVNDRFGHLAGDELIREVGDRLSRVLKGKDAVARLGGDEFAILLEGDDLAEGMDCVLERILLDLHRPYDVLGNQAHIGVSMGVAVAPECGTDRTDLMRKADIALYRAKDDGRDCYRYFTPSMDETVQLRAMLEEDLRAAIASGSSLSVHYQPLVDSRQGKITGLEALLRWQHEEHGAISPQLFIPVAEETGLISALGDWVIEESCKVARDWPNLTIAINLSPIQFCDEGFADRVCDIVARAKVSPHQIEFEVTEGVVLDQNEVVRGALRRLRQMGFRIALDDFGTGYSSLSYLREFEVDRIKIDKSFVHSLGQTMDANAIITAVVTLGHAMGLQVTAEGVETADQEDFLRSAGCNVLQGFRFSQAVPANELTESMAEHARRAA
ncbi:putative bifunctional diguanylate cyclase/phosphodiesterase [Croceibacterium aestuarii]|uniref:putative bifunctional diguanylate cyclase/phosphodiesterase n=1 Tax=Croceibacterium aestuarii TaxID=3064139 RepID=UPI00272E3772|nr:EAL domain-containing protein [Croceibacterium sp. D39]